MKIMYGQVILIF